MHPLMNPSAATNYAAIDIGSNAVRLLIKRLEEEGADKPVFSKVLLLRVPLRLGFDVFALGKITDRGAKNLLRLMKAYRQLMLIHEVEDYRACATSAMRDAKNGRDIIRKIEKETGIRIDIIDGQEEAKIVYNNHIECMADRTGNFMYVDVGGGSTEVNLLSQGQLQYSASYNIGTVRMLNNAVTDGEWDRLRTEIQRLALSYPDTNVIGSGGNINKLYRLAAKKDKARQRMTVEALAALHAQLEALSLEQRREQFGLKPDRADVIVPAGEIFLTIARILGASYVYVPVIGLSDGIIDSLYARNSL